MIPTKNRYETLLPVLEAFIKNIQGDNYEIVVQDNSDNNQPFTGWSQKFHDEKIKYFYEPEKLDIIQNTTRALEHCNGEYLIFIGDDDFVSPYIVKITEFIKARNIECLIYPPGRYWWDTVIFDKETEYLKKEIYWEPLNINTDLIKMDSKKELSYVLKHGGIAYYQLPRFYHGLVKREVLEKIKLQIGSYLPGISPDMGFAVSLALVIKTYYFMNYSASVFGASRNSGGGWTASKTHYSRIEEVPFLPVNAGDQWSSCLPKIWSEQITYAQTIYNVFRTFNLDCALNYEYFYAAMLVNEPILNLYTFPAMKCYCKYNILKYIKIFYKALIQFFKKETRPLRFKMGGFKFKLIEHITINDIYDILKNHAYW